MDFNVGLNVDQLLSMFSVNFSREKFANNEFMQMQSVSITLDRRIRNRA